MKFNTNLQMFLFLLPMQWGRNKCNLRRPSTSYRLSRQVGIALQLPFVLTTVWIHRGTFLQLPSSPSLRVQAICNCLQGSPSEAVSFTTSSCEPEPPNPPRKASGTKNTLVLQWKVKTGRDMINGLGTFLQAFIWLQSNVLLRVKIMK